jgi:hypothetical protein
MSSRTIERTKEGIFEVTEADYQEQLAAGIEEEFLIKPGQYKFFRGRHPQFHPGDLDPRNTTVTVTLPVTLDVFKYFERRAAELKAESYKTLMADALRGAMEQVAQNGARQTADYSVLLNDKQFITAVAERVKAASVAKKSPARKRKRPAKSRTRAKAA